MPTFEKAGKNIRVMCGIAAIFAYGQGAAPIEARELAAINAAQARRGPDGAGSWIADDGRVGLAHRRLAIIDLSDAARQPMADEAAGLRITYNGEIYNFRALRRELEAAGHVFKTQSDTEVLLRLYRQHGPNMVRGLRGMYAFALWDEGKQGLLLARDGFGVKPLYLADDGQTLRVASQVKALQAGGRVGRGSDPAGHVGFFLFGSVPEPHTLFKDIQALPAGHALWVERGGGRRLERFFDPGAVLADQAAGATPDLRALLADSVAHHLIADVPVGVFLSAGLDSATIAALASEVKGASLETVTLGFEEFRGTANDETVLAETVAATYGTRHRTLWVTASEFHDHLQGVLAAMDQPSIDGLNTYFVAKAAAGLGLKVALAGLGGDELFQGYDTFRQVPALAAVLGFVPGARAFGRLVRVATAGLARRLARPKYAGLVEYGASIGDAYLLRRGLFMPWELEGVLDPETAREGWRALAPLTRLEQGAAGIAPPGRQVAALEIAWYMRNQLLRDADWAGMAHSLEIRVPFVDDVLFRALAGWLGRADGPDKRAMAATPLKPLPRALLSRPKTGFRVPVGDWLRARRGGQGERGLRGWARMVHAAFVPRP